ncbi:MAG: enoyl-CoA hydratase/isomerase family protein [Gammaproteobacteria bacterium]|nr:enoyl-CoA hydratase/isomerase family protein [Gammaproteobacteria bacterium]MBQ0839401.1 enoyl-CoA hydratase/isomerase family protein [Gammaproteobacteria bacterium]
MEYADYEHLLFDLKPNGVLTITLNRPEVMNATNARLHWELTQVWDTVAKDDDTNVVVVTGAGKAFSAGGDLNWVEGQVGNAAGVQRIQKEAADIVYRLLALEKPVISAINGVAVGAGLAVALMADISVMSETAKFTDGHVKLGVGAGDHAAIIWPLLCGMAKAKYYLMTAEFINGVEAERMGMVTMCKPADEVLPKAMEIADKLAAGSQQAIRGTKSSLNGWMQMASPIFDNSLRMEMLCFLGEDAAEGIAAVKEKRPAVFPSAKKG